MASVFFGKDRREKPAGAKTRPAVFFKALDLSIVTGTAQAKPVEYLLFCFYTRSYQMSEHVTGTVK
jgi:hypothetical protein